MEKIPIRHSIYLLVEVEAKPIYVVDGLANETLPIWFCIDLKQKVNRKSHG